MSAPAASRAGRVAAIDVVRGATVLLMLLVNDLASVEGVPAWLRHFEPHDGDGMTIVDVVFPAFVFIVGLCIPLVVQPDSRRRAIWPWPIVRRSLALIVLGVLMVNAHQSHDAERSILSAGQWELLVYASALALWLEGPRLDPWLRPQLRRRLGACGLVLAALCFRGTGREDAWIELQVHWWGILGLIGWAYGLAASVYLAIGPRPRWLALAIGIGYGQFVVTRVDPSWLGPLETLSSGLTASVGSLAALCLSGALLTQVARPCERPEQLRTAPLLAFAVVTGSLAFALHAIFGDHPAFYFNKNAATPPWALVSSALTAVALAASGPLATRVPRWLVHLGGAAIIAFLLEPALLIAFASLGPFDPHAAMGDTFVIGLLRASLFSALVVSLSAAAFRAGLRFRP